MALVVSGSTAIPRTIAWRLRMRTARLPRGLLAAGLAVAVAGLELAAGRASAWPAAAVADATPVSSKAVTANVDRRRTVLEMELMELLSLGTCFECPDER